MIEISEVHNPDEKSNICDTILHALPDWFGVEASIADYIQKTRDMIFFTAYDGEAPVGFIALKRHNEYTAEVSVMGILKEYHLQGIGARLIAACEERCRKDGAVYLTVKTLDESRSSASYGKTRAFYRAMGFIPLEVFPLFWDADNPCLFMAKYIG
jgi:GNAT superfamily N-acetyltransferase